MLGGLKVKVPFNPTLMVWTTGLEVDPGGEDVVVAVKLVVL